MFGIEIKNSNNDVLIDGENKHPFFYESKTISLPSSTGLFELNFTPTIKIPFITTFVEDGRVQVYEVFRNAENEYYKFNYAVGKTGGNCTFYIYLL